MFFVIGVIVGGLIVRHSYNAHLKRRANLFKKK